VHEETQLLHTTTGEEPFRALTIPVHRASTILFPTVDAFLNRHEQFYDGYSYGLHGHPASRSLAAHVAQIEGANHALILPSGMAAVANATLAVVKQGDHVLLPDAVYGPTRAFADNFLAKLGVDTTYYDPLEAGGIAARFTQATRLVWVESPCSYTMEVQDVPAIAKVAHARGALVAADCTWASPLGFKALDKGADIAIQALSKHVSGHSDVLMGSIAVRDGQLYRQIKDAMGFTGQGVSPDDCYLALRGMGTLAVRLERQTRSALAVAKFLDLRAEIAQVLYPVLENDPGHALFQRDFTGAAGVFSFLLHRRSKAALVDFLEGLSVIRLGASWGGLHSLVALAQIEAQRTVSPWKSKDYLVRINIGLEHPDDLIEDLAKGLDRYRAAAK